MSDNIYTVLFLCTGNSARSIMAECALNHWGKGCFQAFSAGSHPTGRVHPMALRVLEERHLPTVGLRSKSWDEFARPESPPLDFVFTVCDNAAGEVCPIWPGQPMTAHWGVADPATFVGSEGKTKRVLPASTANWRAGSNSSSACALRLWTASLSSAASMQSAPPVTRPPMMTQPDILGRRRTSASLGIFERYLTLWVALCIIVGIALGHVLPGTFQLIARAELAQVNLPVAVLIWLMIVPMLLKIDFGALHKVAEHWRGIGVTLFVNWAVKPFSMALLAWLFIGFLFAPFLPAPEIPSYIAGLIILAAAPCTAMVFVWSNLSDGEPHFTLTQVALNDAIMVVAFAPIVGLLLGLSAIVVPWETLLLSVVLYIVVPVIVAQLWRHALLVRGGEAQLARILTALHPVSLVALLATLVLLFGFQGEQIIAQPLVILLLAIPILIQVYLNAGLAYWLSRQLGVAHCVAAPAALIGASNFFELAVAAAISLFGLQSGAALATVVGVLIEVPVMLSVVRIVTATRGWYEQKAYRSV